MSGAAPSALRSALDSSIQACADCDSSLVAKKRAEALHLAFFSNQASEPTTVTYILQLLLLCVSTRV